MGDFLKNLAALIKVKTIVTLVVVAVFAILALRGGLAAVVRALEVHVVLRVEVLVLVVGQHDV